MKQYTITSNDADQRLDRFLKKILPNASLGFLYKLIRKGNIKINTLEKKKTKQAKEYKLQVGEDVQIFLGDSEIEELQKQEKKATFVSQNEKLHTSSIVYEDETLLVVNKNPGLNVHPGDHKTTEVSLIDQVHDYFSGKHDSFTFKPSLAHRIDRDTSGIIMIAKEKQMLMRLTSDFKKKEALKKTYFCLVLGKMSRSSGTIRKKLQRIEDAQNENKVQVSEQGQEAITHYKVLDEYTLQLPQGEQIVTALEVTIETWRMHQIRVHMEALWNPIIWDKPYGNKKLNAYFSKHYQINRQMLHAWKIEFFHVGKNKSMKLEAKQKKDMFEFIWKIK